MLAMQAVPVKNCARSTFATIPLTVLISLYSPPLIGAKNCQPGRQRKVPPLVGLWTVDQCPFSPTGKLLLRKVRPVIPR